MDSLVEPPNFKFSNVRAFFTTRIIGNNSDKQDAVARILGVSRDMVYLPVQKHTSDIQVIDSVDPVREQADGVVTNQKGIVIGVVVADCVPVILYDRSREVSGAVHAGWRGTADGIIKHAITKMIRRFGCRPGDIVMAIGPSIRKCSYDVSRDVKEAIEDTTGNGEFYSIDGERYFVDLANANEIQALSMGLLQSNIWKSDECTFCNPDKYYSYRYNRDCAGRQGGFIVMW